MSTEEEPPPDWKKQGLIRSNNIEDFLIKTNSNNLFSKKDISKLKEFEDIIKQNQGEYFLLEHTPYGKKNPRGKKGNYIIGILKGELCYSFDGKRYGSPFETYTELPGFLQHFYKKEVIFRTQKRTYTQGGMGLKNLDLYKIEEDPALDIKEILNGEICSYFGNGSWIKGHFKPTRKSKITNGKKETYSQITSATKAMHRLFVSKNIPSLMSYLDCNLLENKWTYKKVNQTF